MKNHSIVVCKSTFLDEALKMHLSCSEAERLWVNLDKLSVESSRSKISNAFYFLGAWVVILALAWFMGDRYMLYGTSALLPISICYAIGFTGVGWYLWDVKQKKTLGGLGIFLGISLVPLMTYAIQDLIGWWPGKFPGQYSDFFGWIRSGWSIMELMTIGTSLIALYFVRFAQLTVPLYVALWFMTMDIAAIFPPAFIDQEHLIDRRTALCILLGLILIVNAIFQDRSQKTAFAFWGHLFGVAIFWSGITAIDYTGWIENSIYFLLNVGMIVLSPVLGRRVFLVFGSIGVISHIFCLAHRYFADSASFPLILSGVGILVIISGWVIQRNWHILKHYSPKK